MKLFNIVLICCVAVAALGQNPEVTTAPNTRKKRMHNNNWLPEEWRQKGATLKFAPRDNTVGSRVSRYLKELFSFSPGTGFVVFTAFSDRECMHPTWESGMNVGQCMTATSSDGTMLGSLRADVVMSKGEIAVKIHTWTDPMCMSTASPMPTEEVAMVARLTCGSYKADINGQKSFSGQYSFQNLDTIPKFYNFLAHGRLEL